MFSYLSNQVVIELKFNPNIFILNSKHLKKLNIVKLGQKQKIDIYYIDYHKISYIFQITRITIMMTDNTLHAQFNLNITLSNIYFTN